MGDALTTAPAWVIDLRSGLLAEGFELTLERRYDESFGNYVAKLARGHSTVVPNLDRGVWDIGVEAADAPPSDIWVKRETNVHLLRQSHAGTLSLANAVPTDLAGDSRWLLNNLSTVDDLVSSDATWRVLYEFQRQYARQQFGADLPPWPST